MNYHIFRSLVIHFSKHFYHKKRKRGDDRKQTRDNVCSIINQIPSKSQSKYNQKITHIKHKHFSNKNGTGQSSGDLWGKKQPKMMAKKR